MSDPALAIVLEDEDDVRELIAFHLSEAGFEVSKAGSIAEARGAMQDRGPAVIVVDRMLPDGDGVAFCGELRSDGRFDHIGILIVSARGSEDDRVEGLMAGADDYLVKPFSIRELVARVKILGVATADRHSAKMRPAAPMIFRWRAMMVDVERQKVTIDGNKVPLRPVELRILITLLEAPGRPFTRNELISRLWSADAPPSIRVIDTHIRRLRDGLGPYAIAIETIHGSGYRVAPES